MGPCAQGGLWPLLPAARGAVLEGHGAVGGCDQETPDSSGPGSQTWGLVTTCSLKEKQAPSQQAQSKAGGPQSPQSHSVCQLRTSCL